MPPNMKTDSKQSLLFLVNHHPLSTLYDGVLFICYTLPLLTILYCYPYNYYHVYWPTVLPNFG